MKSIDSGRSAFDAGFNGMDPYKAKGGPEKTVAEYAKARGQSVAAIKESLASQSLEREQFNNWLKDDGIHLRGV